MKVLPAARSRTMRPTRLRSGLTTASGPASARTGLWSRYSHVAPCQLTRYATESSVTAIPVGASGSDGPIPLVEITAQPFGVLARYAALRPAGLSVREPIDSNGLPT